MPRHQQLNLLSNYIKTILRETTDYKSLGAPSNLFIRFGRFSGGRSKVGLDAEFRREVLAGKQYEAGLSVYFAKPFKNGYQIIEPESRRAAYGIGSNYFGHMISNIFMPEIARENIFLIKGNLIKSPDVYYDDQEEQYVRTGRTTYEVGSDGEPVIENPRIVKNLSPEEVYLSWPEKSLAEVFQKQIDDEFGDMFVYYLENSMDNEELKKYYKKIDPDIILYYEDKLGKKKLEKSLDKLSDLWDAGQKISIEEFLKGYK